MLLNTAIKGEIKKVILKKIEEERNIVYIISTYPLKTEEIEDLKKGLTFLKDKEIKNIVKKEIFGGLIIKFGSYEIDLSLAGKFKNIKKALIY